jgi:hypothetical protein
MDDVPDRVNGIERERGGGAGDGLDDLMLGRRRVGSIWILEA